MKKLLTLLVCGMTIHCFSQQSSGESSSALGVSGTGLWTVIAANYRENILSDAVNQSPTGALNAGYPVEINALFPTTILLEKQYYGNGLAGRYGLLLGRIDQTDFSSDVSGLETSQVTTSLSSFSFGFSGGFEKHLDDEFKNLDPYIGTDLILSFITGVQYTQTEEISSAGSKSGDYSSNSNFTADYPGATGLSLHLLTGFNYFFTPYFSLGGEAGAGFSLLRMKGGYSTDYSGASTTGSTTTTSSILNDDQNDNQLSGYAFNSIGTVNVIFYW